MASNKIDVMDNLNNLIMSVKIHNEMTSKLSFEQLQAAVVVVSLLVAVGSGSEN
jgi:hypothetical protein